MAEAQPITKDDLKESFKEFRKDVKKDVLEAIDERVPILLGEFTEEVLLPSVATMIREELAMFEHRIKAYIDGKIAAINGDRELFRKFMIKTVDLLRHHRLGTETEIDDLRRLIPQR